MNPDILFSLVGIFGIGALIFVGWRIIQREKNSRRQQ